MNHKTLIFLLILLSFSTKAQQTFTPKKYHQFISKTQISAIIFIEPDCPISQKAIPTLKYLADSLKDKVAFLGIFPSKYPNKKLIKEFIQKYQIPFPCWIDAKQQLTKQFEASVTPEVFLLNTKQKIQYQGMIDNQFYTLGKSRNVATEHYLKDAINAYLNNRPIKINKTQAVGCDIEK